ncbi:MAG: T9SS type A sorting domain-containing protein [Bacteroidota bacterium]
MNPYTFSRLHYFEKQLLSLIVLLFASCFMARMAYSQSDQVACPPDVSISCDDGFSPFPSDADYNPALGVPNVLIPCELVTFIYDDVILPGDCPNNYTIERHWDGTGDCNASLRCIQRITVSDNEPPGPIAINVPLPSDQDCELNSLPVFIAWADMVAFDVVVPDNCGGVVLSHDLSLSSPLINLPTCTAGNRIAYYRVTFTATDLCGNTSSAIIKLYERDNEAPEITPAAPLTLSCTAPNREQIIQNWIRAFTAFDFCQGPVVVTNDYDPNAFEPINAAWGCGLVNYVEFTASDPCGNRAERIGEIRLIDDTPPVISVPADLYLDCDHPNIPLAIENWINEFTFTDECQPNGPLESDHLITTTIDNDNCPNDDLRSCTLTVTDACGNSASATGRIYIQDNTPPVIEYDNQTLTVSCDDPEKNAKIFDWLSSFSSVDNCDPTSYVGSTFFFDGFDSPCGIIGTQEVDFIAYDACGNQGNLKAIVVVTPVPPRIDCRPDQFVSCFSDIVVPSEALLVDGCADIQSQSHSPLRLVSGQPNCDGAIYEVTRTVTDICDQQSRCTERYIIQNAAPIVSCLPGLEVSCKEDIIVSPNDVSYTTSCGLGATVRLMGPIRSGVDNCSGASYTYRYVVTDACGRASFCERRFTINNNPAPTISVPALSSVACFKDIQPSPSDAVVTTSCGLQPTVSISAPVQQGPNHCPGTRYTYIYTVQDACGRQASAERSYILDNEAPEIILPEDITVHCIDDIQASKADAQVIAACEQGYTLTFEAPALYEDYNCATVTLPYLYTATDACGRSTSATRYITVEHKAPFIEMPQPMVMDCLDEQALEDNFPFAFSYCGELHYTIDISKPEVIYPEKEDCSYELYTVIYSVTDECGVMICVEAPLRVEQELVQFEPVLADTVLACGEQLEEPEVLAYSTCGGQLEVELEEERYTTEEGKQILERRWTAESPCGGVYEQVQLVELECDDATFGERQQDSNDIVVMEKPKSVDSYRFLLFPNPVQSRLQIEFDELGEAMQRAKVHIFSQEGQEVYRDALWINADRKLIHIEVSKLPAGTYTLAMSIDGVQQTAQTFVKLDSL